MAALDHPRMLTQELPFGDNHQTFWMNLQTHWTVGQGCGDAVSVALEADQAGWRDSLAVPDKAIEGGRQGHQREPFFGQDVGNVAL